ncbi:NTP/NDP exchange transporter [Arenimonas fontis]|uniref:MFS transporter n=1 Tax=Arenimonas fontis TaxID=2608255 RepID=A0A5B2ZAV9_9GAMM|nr:MFS transporter [Arenimonas fontis]KAA2285246.1 MFS transporter [Arenimonas fontis]
MSPDMPAKAGRLDHLRLTLREFPPLIWSFLYFFFLLTGYYVLRPVRDAMGASADVQAVFPAALVRWASERGWDLGGLTLQLLFTGTFVAMLLLQPVYGALVSRFPRRVFLPVLYLLFIVCLIGFHLLFEREAPGRGAAFFIWVAVFNLFAVSVFWSFMADIYSDPEARRLYGFIAAGGTVGGFTGPSLTSLLVGQVGVANLLLVSAVLLGLCVVCILRLGRWARLRETERGWRGAEQAMGGSVLAGLRLLRDEPLLRAMAVVMFFGVGVGTLLYNEQAAIARAFFPEDGDRTAYYASIDLAINLVTILVQLFVTRPLLVRFGVKPALLIPAFAILGGFALLSASPLPMLVAVVQVLTRAGEFSLAKPARETIYTRVGREIRYKGKAVVDTAVYRFGDLFFVWSHKALAVFGSSLVFGVGALVAAGLGLGAFRLVREQARLPADPDRR